jgi:hypothetical protein
MVSFNICTSPALLEKQSVAGAGLNPCWGLCSQDIACVESRADFEVQATVVLGPGLLWLPTYFVRGVDFQSLAP